MHQNFTKHGRLCKENNQLPTNSHDELEDDSIVAKISSHICGSKKNPNLVKNHGKQQNLTNLDTFTLWVKPLKPLISIKNFVKEL